MTRPAGGRLLRVGRARAAVCGLAWAASACAGGGVGSAGVAPGGSGAPDRDYLVLVASEATDEVQLVRFRPSGDGGGSATVERRHGVGFHPADPDGPHGLAVSPDGRSYYVTTAHGVPNGYIWRFSAEDGRSLGQAELGLFPASVDVSPDGFYAYVVNFNLHGDMVPSSVSIVSTAEMIEVARLRTCVMPHGSRLSPDGAHHYSTCMMDDLLVDIDARGFQVARHFMLTPGSEHGMSGAPQHAAGMSMGSTGRCSPTWAAPSPDGSRVYVACNQANDVAEIDVGTWTLVRRIPAGEGVYNLAAVQTARGDDVLIATNRRGQSVSFFDTESARELARVETLRPVLHGIATSDDGRYAFVSVEGVGAAPGTVEVIDLATFRRVAAADLGQMSGGIDFLRSEPAAR